MIYGYDQIEKETISVQCPECEKWHDVEIKVSIKKIDDEVEIEAK